MNWSELTTQGRIDAIRSVWQPGMSAAQIASHFDGVSRNAVIGIFHRHADKIGASMYLGVKGENGQAKSLSVKATRKRGGIRGGTVSRNRLRIVKPEPAIDHVVFGTPQTAGIPLMMLESCRCKWPINDGGPFLFCGEAKSNDGPYCAYHATRAVGPGTESERSADRAARHLAAA